MFQSVRVFFVILCFFYFIFSYIVIALKFNVGNRGAKR